MHTIRKWIRNLFGFSGKEINGFIVLLPLMLLLIMTQPLYHMWRSNQPRDFAKEKLIADSLITLWDQKTDSAVDITKPQLFRFNPNLATIEDLKKLGFPDALSTRVANYRQKGGQFRIKSDLLKIYAFDSTFYLQLYAYIGLPENPRFSGKNKLQERPSKSDVRNARHSVTRFDLNKADTVQLKSIYGIGSKLAGRIIKFRDALGGFINRDQLKEVYGLDSIVVNNLWKMSFITEDFVPRKIDLNSANEKDLSGHPYIKRTYANSIIAFRFQHGPFQTTGELRKLSAFKPEDIDKILPYLKVNQ